MIDPTDLLARRAAAMGWSAAGFEPLGDPHRGGQRVGRIRLPDGRSIGYKPRPVAPERFLAGLIEALGRDGLDLGRPPEVIDRGDHGWVEWIAERLPDDEAESRRLARRAGALLAVLELLEFRDAHRDNVLAAGDRAVVVDAETIGHPRLPRFDQVESVVLTGFLPWNPAQPTDPGRHAGVLGTIDASRWGGPAALVERVLAGYEEGHAAVRRQQSLVLDGLAALDARVVLRPTAEYIAALGRASLPDAPELGAAVIASERRQLGSGDVPVFHAPVRSRDLRTDVETVRGYFPRAALDRVADRLVAPLDPERDRARRLIRSVLLLATLAEVR